MHQNSSLFLSSVGGITLQRPYYVDAYAHRLAELDAGCGVIAVSDICDEQGVCLVPANTHITPAIVDRLVNCTLHAPFELSVRILEELTVDEICCDLEQLLVDEDFFMALYERHQFMVNFKILGEAYIGFPLVRQKITVMAATMPSLYNRTLYSALFALLIAQEMRLPQEELGDIFMAALCHDLGMLHVESTVLSKPDPLCTEDWVNIQMHVIHSRDTLLMAGVSPEVVNAAFEHHERCDGTGYPLGKVESEISLIGQIIALVDSVVAIYFNYFKEHGRGWREVIAVIQMNAQAYIYRSVELLSAIVRRAELPVDRVVVDSCMPEFAEKMLAQNLHLQDWFEQLRAALQSVGYKHGDRKLHALQNVVIHIATTFKGSELFEDEFRDTLKALRSTPDAQLAKKIEDASIMQHEMMFHLQKLTRMLDEYLSAGSHVNPDIVKKLQSSFVSVKKYLLVDFSK